MEKNAKKESKKSKNKIYYAKTSEQKEMGKFFVVLLVVLLAVGAIYFLTRAFVTKDLFKKSEPRVTEVTPGVIDYTTITMGMIMNRPDDEYYVAIYNANSDNASTMSSLISTYKKQEKHLPVYVVDLSNEFFNGSYYDINNIPEKPTTLEEIKVGDRTLIKIKKGQIDKFIPDLKKTKDKEGEKISSNFSAIEKELTPATTSKK